MEASCYDHLNHGNCGTKPHKEDQGSLSSSIYEHLDLSKEVPVISVSDDEKRLSVKRLSTKIVIAALLVIAYIIVILLASATLMVLSIKTSQMEASLPKSNTSNDTPALQELQRQLKALSEYSATLSRQCPCTSNHSYKNGSQSSSKSTTAPLLIVSSCSTLPKSSPSGHYHILSSDGSAARVFCDMSRTCGNVTGGWMRAVSLDMRQPKSKCPSDLCLSFATSPRTCGRCNIPKFPVVTYHVGAPYSKVCGKLIAYQFGTPDAFSPNHTTAGFDGITLTYGRSERHIWSFIAALQEKYDVSNSACPCLNPEDNRIPKSPSLTGDHYFCDTGAFNFHQKILYPNNPLWDGQGCNEPNKYCSFNSPPWFYRQLPEITTEPINMKVHLDEGPCIEDIAIERVDIYVQ